METFNKLFGSLLAFVYHCFDRIVIQGYLPLLTREEHMLGSAVRFIYSKILQQDSLQAVTCTRCGRRSS